MALDAAERARVAKIEGRLTAWQQHLASMPAVSKYLNTDEWRTDYDNWLEEAQELVEVDPNDVAFLLALIQRLAPEQADGSGG